MPAIGIISGKEKFVSSYPLHLKDRLLLLVIRFPRTHTLFCICKEVVITHYPFANFNVKSPSFVPLLKPVIPPKVLPHQITRSFIPHTPLAYLQPFSPV
jgi:hypothetical protein